MLGYKNVPLLGGGFDIQTDAQNKVRVDTRRIISKGKGATAKIEKPSVVSKVRKKNSAKGNKQTSD